MAGQAGTGWSSGQWRGEESSTELAQVCHHNISHSPGLASPLQLSERGYDGEVKLRTIVWIGVPSLPRGQIIVLYCLSLSLSLGLPNTVYSVYSVPQLCCSFAPARCASYSTYRTCGLEFGQLE